MNKLINKAKQLNKALKETSISKEYFALKEALEKLKLNDSSITFEPETSSALGFGFRCGFLGMLHMEIAQERLEREYDLSLVTTAPSVVYKVHKTNGEIVEIDNPANLPAAQYRDYIEEPYVKVQIITPNEYVGTLMDLAQTKRGIFLNMTYLDKGRVDLAYEIPLSEVITDFYDQLKSRTKGYASLDYEFEDYKRSKLIKLDVMLAGEVVDALSVICHEDNAYYIGQKLTEKHIERFIKLNVEPQNIKFSKKLLINENLLNCNDYEYRIELMKQHNI